MISSRSPDEHPIECVQRELDAMVGHAVVLEVVRPDLLGTTAALHLFFRAALDFRVLPFLLRLQQTRAQDAHRLVLVLELALLVLAGDDHARRLVGDAHRGVGGVDRLTSGPGRRGTRRSADHSDRPRRRPRRPREGSRPSPRSCAPAPGSRFRERAARGAGRPRT